MLLDRAFDANGFLTGIDAAGAKLLARAKATRNLRLLLDGSFLSVLDGLAVRIIEARITMTGAGGTVLADDYRLITTLLDHRRDSADVLPRLYHERWEIESAFLALCQTILRGHVLCSGDPVGVQ